MDRVRVVMFSLAWLVVTILSIPIIAVWLIVNFVIYGVVKLERTIVENIDDDEVNDAWNELWCAIFDCVESGRDELSEEMEL